MIYCKCIFFQVTLSTSGNVDEKLIAEQLPLFGDAINPDRDGNLIRFEIIPSKKQNGVMVKLYTLTRYKGQYFKLNSESLHEIDGLDFLLVDNLLDKNAVSAMAHCVETNIKLHAEQYAKANETGHFATTSINIPPVQELILMVEEKVVGMVRSN